MPDLADLQALYRDYSDVELLEAIAAGSDSFTDTAWQALQEELTCRDVGDEAALAAEPALPAPAAHPPYPAAPYGPRCLAFCIDWFIARWPVVLGVLFFRAKLDADALGRVISLLLLACALWGVYYSFTKDGRPGGQSKGKKHLGLMVVRLSTNEPCSSAESQIRALPVTLLGFVEVLAVIASADGRRRGDRLAGTQVIEVSAYERLTRLDGQESSHTAQYVASGIDDSGRTTAGSSEAWSV